MDHFTVKLLIVKNHEYCRNKTEIVKKESSNFYLSLLGQYYEAHE
jgi:hypothetical protein